MILSSLKGSHLQKARVQSKQKWPEALYYRSSSSLVLTVSVDI